MDLWWDDYLHASKYGSYLSALVSSDLTGIDPWSFGAARRPRGSGIAPGMPTTAAVAPISSCGIARITADGLLGGGRARDDDDDDDDD